VNVETYQLYDVSEEVCDENDIDMKVLLVEKLSLIKEDDLQLIEMRFFEKRSYREIGDILELTENNAKVKTFRALEKLKKMILKK